jgi:hypothetical protein
LGYHTFCLKPELAKIPEGSWVCPTCVEQRGIDPVVVEARVQEERQALLKVPEAAEPFQGALVMMEAKGGRNRTERQLGVATYAGTTGRTHTFTVRYDDGSVELLKLSQMKPRIVKEAVPKRANARAAATTSAVEPPMRATLAGAGAVERKLAELRASGAGPSVPARLSPVGAELASGLAAAPHTGVWAPARTSAERRAGQLTQTANWAIATRPGVVGRVERWWHGIADRRQEAARRFDLHAPPPPGYPYEEDEPAGSALEAQCDSAERARRFSERVSKDHWRCQQSNGDESLEEMMTRQMPGITGERLEATRNALEEGGGGVPLNPEEMVWLESELDLGSQHVVYSRINMSEVYCRPRNGSGGAMALELQWGASLVAHPRELRVMMLSAAASAFVVSIGAAVADFLLPSACERKGLLIVARVPKLYVVKAHPARLRWLRNLRWQGRLATLPSEKGLWVCIFADEEQRRRVLRREGSTWE